ncbi:MAG: type IV pilus modification PilV family protein [Ilumatobacteraceae bacterium]
MRTRSSCAGAGRSRDAGFSLVEVVIAIVLIGLTGTAGLVTLRTAINASATNRDHANAHAWLQTATDVLYGVERQDCGTTTAALESTVRAYYQTVVRGTSNPAGWPAANIEVVAPVKFWDGQSTYQSTCYDDLGINLQLITLRVRNPDGEIVETVEIVKG